MTKPGEIRLLFDAKMKETIPTPTFDPRDLDRIKSDIYLYRVLEHCQNNVQQAAEMLFNIMAWRKANEANEISEATVDVDILNRGLYFTSGRDIDSCLLFIMNSKVYVKSLDVDAVKKVFIYWLERLEREEGGKKVTLFFDMDGCGVNNMNMQIISYMISVLKSYYPNFINYIIIFQMPWILSAGFRIVKEMLPAPAVDRLRIINKEKLKELVAPEQALVSWGGRNDYLFKFVPENRQIATLTTLEEDNYSLGEMLKLKPAKTLLFNTISKKITSQLIITNMDDSVVAFKIRTTAPERYYVRPNSGILPRLISQNIEITVQSGYQIDSIDKDRFLVVSVNVPKLNMTPAELAQTWKTAGSNIDEYRLCCAKLDHKISSVETKHDMDPVTKSAISMDIEYKKINKNLNLLSTYQIIVVFLMLALIVLNVLIFTHIGKPSGSHK